MFRESILGSGAGIERIISFMKRGRFGWLAKEGLIIIIHIYQHTFSVLLGPCCRFTPSCSSYAVLSIERFGIVRGAWLVFKRLIKCHPFHPGGYDPVPGVPNS